MMGLFIYHKCSCKYLCYIGAVLAFLLMSASVDAQNNANSEPINVDCTCHRYISDLPPMYFMEDSCEYEFSRSNVLKLCYKTLDYKDSLRIGNHWFFFTVKCTSPYSSYSCMKSELTVHESIRDYIYRDTAHIYNYTRYSDERAMNLYAKREFDKFVSEIKDFCENTENCPKADWKVTITTHPIYENDSIVTMSIQTYYYLYDAAYSTCINEAASFNKKRGFQYGFDLLSKYSTSEINTLLKEGLKSYLRITSDEELKNMLPNFIDINNLPLPRYCPFITRKGVRLVYQNHEIWGHAGGFPNFIIPLK